MSVDDYKEMTHQAAFSGRMCLADAYRTCRSFRKLVASVGTSMRSMASALDRWLPMTLVPLDIVHVSRHSLGNSTAHRRRSTVATWPGVLVPRRSAVVNDNRVARTLGLIAA